jgi:hypothetical protein
LKSLELQKVLFILYFQGYFLPCAEPEPFSEYIYEEIE